MDPLIKAPLQDLFHLIAQAQTEADLRQSFMDAVGQYFEAKRWQLYFLSQLPAVDDNTPTLLKRALSLESNPVLRYLVQNHAAVHD